MKIYKKSMLIEESDNVAVAVEPIQAGECTLVAGEEITANEYIKEGHKIARTDIEKGAEIIKYGVHIGVATQFIKKGDWVHEHNVYDDFEEINREQRAYYRSMAPDAMDYTIHHKYKKEELGLPETIMGYKRADGSFGIRNQVVVISLVQCSNNAAQRISAACNVPATFVDAACGEFPDRFERTRRGFITTGTHPNTFGVVLLSLGCQQTDPEDVAEEIRKTGRPVVNISIQADGGVTKAIQDGDFFENPALMSAINQCKWFDSTLHIFGLLSDGGVHSHIQHIFAMVKMAHDRGIGRVYLHCFLDGRDVAPTSGAGYVRQLRDYCAELDTGKIATLQGRFYGMDRDKRWDRIEASYNAMVCGEGIQDPDPVHAMEASYAAGVTDEFVKPVVCDPNGRIQSGDSVIFMNFRPDRAREMTYALTQPDFDGFRRKIVAEHLHYVCTTRYDEKLTGLPVAFPPEELHDTLGEIVSAHGLRQLRIAETEKYAHVTFFFNGGTETQYPGEDRILVKSPAVATYDLQPEMSAYEVTDKMVEAVKSGKYDALILNYANCDMVGHTGVFDAAVKAVEAVDTAVDQVVSAVLNAGGCAFITADHGNAEKMMNPDGTPFTAHTTNVVPFVAVGCGDVKLREGGCLADIAPTMLPYIGLPVPAEMTGKSIIVE